MSAVIVFSKSWLSQSAAIDDGNSNPLIIFRAATSGLYRMNVAARVSGTATIKVMGGLPPYDSASFPPTYVGSGGGGVFSSFVGAMNASETAKIQAQITSGGPEWYYNLYVTIEQLQ